MSGISPYCQISINNQNCDEAVQKYVTYSFDKETYANGDKVEITAKLAGNTGNEDYVLSSQSSEYCVNNQPEYITSTAGIDLNSIKNELDDFVTSNIAEAIKKGTDGYYYSSILGTDVGVELKKVENLTAGAVYFQSKKLQKQSEQNQYFNYLSFTYSGTYIGEYGSGNFYSCVSAVNIIKYPDGTIKWGSKSTDAYDFIAEGSTEGMEYSISSYITTHSSDYNISSVDI